jgi:hypothetical protein
MTLGYFDILAAHKVYALPHNHGESRIDYAKRFFQEIRGLGCIAIVTASRGKIRRRALRGL